MRVIASAALIAILGILTAGGMAPSFGWITGREHPPELITTSISIPILLDDVCKCTAKTGEAQGNKKFWACPSGSGAAQITANTTQLHSSTCTPGTGQTCSTPNPPNNCTAVVSAELTVPAGCLPGNGNGSVVGKTIETSDAPCRIVIPGQPPTGGHVATWELVAPCKAEANSPAVPGTEPMLFGDAPCSNNQPGGNIQLIYTPTLTCEKCTRSS